MGISIVKARRCENMLTMVDNRVLAGDTLRGVKGTFVRVPLCPYLRRSIVKPLVGLVFLGLLVFGGELSAVGQELILVDGKLQAAQLKRLGSDQLVFEASQKEVTVPTEKLIRWGSFRDIQDGEWLCLRDGTLLRGTFQGLTAEGIAWRNEFLGELTVDRADAGGLFLHVPAESQERDRLLDGLVAAGQKDAVLLSNGDRVEGIILPTDGGTRLRMRTILGEQVLDRSQVNVVQFAGASSARNATRQRIVLGLVDGSRVVINDFGDLLSGSSETPKDGPTQPSRPGGLPLQALLDDGLSKICAVQVLASHVVYLSDLEPQQYVSVPFLESVRPMYKDRNAAGSWLRTDDAVYLKGLGLYSACRVRYPLQSRFSRFEADIALDRLANRRGSVICYVLVDGQQRAAIGPLRGGEPPKSVSLDVTDAAYLDLVVDFGEWADALDYVNWLDARLILATQQAAQDNRSE